MGSVAVIGAGMAGLACASALAEGGQRVTVVDKGRGLGGRLATRRCDAGTFDHGAPGVQGEGEFARWLETSASLGLAARWGDGWTGLPGMSALVRPLAEGLHLHLSAEVTAMDWRADGWHLAGGGLPEAGPFDRLVLAIPQSQAVRLLAPWPELTAAITPAAMRAVLTVMAAFDAALPCADRLASDGPVATALREGAKPGRSPAPDRWVIHASAVWSAAHLELERPAAAQALLPAFLELAGAPDAVPHHLEGHRWRFGLTDRALGQPFVLDAAHGIGLCGDWCLGDSAADAFGSGRALAAAIPAA